MEIIDLQADDFIKGTFKEESLAEFYNFLPEIHSMIKDFASSFLSVFGTTYSSCEQIFSIMKFAKSKYRGNLSDEHLRDILLIQQTKLEVQFDKIMDSKSRFHTSH